MVAKGGGSVVRIPPLPSSIPETSEFLQESDGRVMKSTLFPLQLPICYLSAVCSFIRLCFASPFAGDGAGPHVESFAFRGNSGGARERGGRDIILGMVAGGGAPSTGSLLLPQGAGGSRCGWLCHKCVALTLGWGS